MFQHWELVDLFFFLNYRKKRFCVHHQAISKAAVYPSFEKMQENKQALFTQPKSPAQPAAPARAPFTWLTPVNAALRGGGVTLSSWLHIWLTSGPGWAGLHACPLAPPAPPSLCDVLVVSPPEGFGPPPHPTLHPASEQSLHHQPLLLVELWISHFDSRAVITTARPALGAPYPEISPWSCDVEQYGRCPSFPFSSSTSSSSFTSCCLSVWRAAAWLHYFFFLLHFCLSRCR